MSGFFLVTRGIFSHPLFQHSGPFTPLEAWLWLIEQANFDEGRFKHGNQMFVIPRGSYGTRYRALAEKWRWSTDRVIRALKMWESQGMVEVETRHGYVHLTVCNYEQHQNPCYGGATATRHERDNDATATSTNQKKEKKEKKEPPTPWPDWLPIDTFEAFREMRKGLRAPLTAKAEQLAIAQLDKLRAEGHDPKLVIEQSILRGWKAFYQLKGDDHDATRSPAKTKFQRAVEATELARAERERGGSIPT